MVRKELIEQAKKEILHDLNKHTCKRCTIRIEEGSLCEKCQRLEDINMEFNRSAKKHDFENQITGMQREIEFKQNQVDTGNIVETRAVRIGNDGMPTIVDGFVDGVKPKHLLLNDIDNLKTRQKLIEKQLKALKEAEEEDARKTAS
jgi:hypothetical protein